MTLRELRLWHWRACLGHRNAETALVLIRGYDHYLTKRERATADFHIGAVQALNDVPELWNTTAEQDAETCTT